MTHIAAVFKFTCFYVVYSFNLDYLYLIMNSDSSSPYLQNVSPVNPSLSPHWVPPSVQIPVYPVIPDITQKQVIPTTQKRRYESFDMVKVVLRNKPTSVFCPSCKLNIMTDLKGRRITLYCCHVFVLIIDCTTLCYSHFSSFL